MENQESKLTTNYLKHLCDRASRSKDLGWIPPNVSIRNNRVMYNISGIEVAVKIISQDTYEREISQDCKNHQNFQGPIPYDGRTNKPNWNKLIEENQVALKEYMSGVQIETQF